MAAQRTGGSFARSLDSEPTTLERRVLAGTGLQLAARIASAFCSASAILLIGRHLGDERLGRFNFHFTLFLIVGALVDLGSMAIAVREATRHPEREAAVLRATFRIRLATVALCVVLCAAISWWKEGSLARAALPMVAALHLLAVAPCTAAAWLQVRVRLTAIALAPLAGFSLYIAAVLLLTHTDIHEPGLFLLAFAGGLFVQGLVPWLAARRHVTLRGPVEPALVRELLLAMVPLGLSAALSTLYFRMDALLLNSLCGDAANGRYARTFPMLSLAIALPTYLSSALFPALTRAAGRGPAPLLALTRRACTVLAGFALPAVAICFAWGGQVLYLFWARHGEGERYADFLADNGDLRRCLPLLAIAGVAIFLTYPQMHALTALGRQRVLARISVVALLLKLLVSSVAIRAQGVLGAALGTLLTEWFVFAWVTLELRRATGALAPSRALLRPLVAGLAVAAVAWPLRDVAPWWTVPLGFALQAGALWLGGALPLRLGIDEASGGTSGGLDTGTSGGAVGGAA